MDWTFQNEVEADWSLCALTYIQKYSSNIHRTSWLFLGHMSDPLMWATIRFLTFASAQLKLALDIHVLVYENSELSADSYQVRCIDTIKNAISADYCICFAYSEDHRQEEYILTQMSFFWEQIAKPVRRAICISNQNAYRAYNYPIAAAEGEFSQTSSNPDCLFTRQVEKLVSDLPGSYIILRPGVVVAPSLGLNTIVELLQQKLSAGESVVLSAQTQYSLVYFTDFLTALVTTAAVGLDREIYNISSAENTVSLLQVCQLFLEQCEQNGICELQVTTHTTCPNYALSGSKLGTLGWIPTVDVKTMVTISWQVANGADNGIWLHGGHQGKLDAIHTCLYQVLQEVDRICKKHQIPYYLGGGTLLGAVRHHGFIPWDDDLDIMMLRRDHDRFLQIAAKELPPHMFLQTPSSEDGNHYLISKIRINQTVFSSQFLLGFPKLHHGIFVDIIAQDYTANSKWGQKLHLKLSLLARGLVFKKWSGTPAASVKKSYAILDPLIRMLPISWMERFQHYVLTMFNNKKNRRFLFDSMGINISKGAYPAQWLSDQVPMLFEGEYFPVPMDYDSYLRYLYNDYTQSVPITQRGVVHEVPWLDLGGYIK